MLIMQKMNKMILQKDLGIKVLGVLLIMLTTGCHHTDYQTLIINSDGNEISLFNSNDFVIDSISIDYLGKNYFSLALINKSKGEDKVSLIKPSSNYKLYLNDLKKIKCEDDIGLNVVIRKKYSNTKVTSDIANNYKHSKDIQVLKSYKYYLCIKVVDTVKIMYR